MLRRTLRLSTAAVVLFPLDSHGPSVLQRSSRLIGNRDARNAAIAAEGFSGGRPNLHTHTLDTHPFAGAPGGESRLSVHFFFN